MMPTGSAKSARVVVVGSVNMDIVVQAKALPAPGETVSGSDAQLLLGGKGANQAIAAQRLGAHVRFIARVGDDAFGRAALAELQADRLDMRSIHLTTGVSTGIAMITLGEGGQNMITLSPGANAHLAMSDVQNAGEAFSGHAILLLQNEVPAAVSRYAAECMRQEGGITILDPAPATGFDKAMLQWADIVTPNETEAQALTGIRVDGVEDGWAAARLLVDAGARVAVIKMGSQGVVYAGAYGEGHVPAPAVVAVNTVAAGDCFNGALAVALGEGMVFRKALAFACHAAALSVTRQGAATSMPFREEMASFLG